MASQSQDNNSIPSGAMRSPDAWGEYNKIFFTVQQALSKMQTATVVKVLSCTNSGGVSPVGTVEVVNMVNQLDAGGNPVEHTTIFNVPYMRMQGGSSAVILDPKAGDIGICLFASRDISKIKATKKKGNPGSNRQYSFSDGMYIGGILNGSPSQYIQFAAGGIKLATSGRVEITSSSLTHNGTNVGSTHTHGGVIPGGGSTGTPQ